MVRFDYRHREDMFDGNTYQKGGRILHMLRNYMGDEAFFESLRIYLEENKYTAVEMHQLRIACEKVLGEDLNWFFNQWFYSKGHPILEINYEYDDSLKVQLVSVEQVQDFKTTPLYRLPFKIDIYVNGKKETKEVVAEEVLNIYSFSVDAKPDLVNVDADKMLLCEKIDNHETPEEWAYMYHHAGRYLDRYESIKSLSKSNEDVAINTIYDALDDKYPYLKSMAIKSIKNALKSNEEKIKLKLLYMAKNDSDSRVRGDAIEALAKYFEDDEATRETIIAGVSEQSYYVIRESLSALSKISPGDAMKFAKALEEEENEAILGAVAAVYAEHGEVEQNAFFIKISEKMTGFEKYGFTTTYIKYLKKQDHKTVEEGLPILKDVALNGKPWWVRLSGINALTDLETKYNNQIRVAEAEMKEAEVGSEKEIELRTSLEKDRNINKKIEEIISEAKASEEHPRLKKMLGLND